MDAVGVDAFRAPAVHCKHNGVDDGRTGAAAVADLSIDADRDRYFTASVRRKWPFHAHWVYGDVRAIVDLVPISHLSRNRARAGTEPDGSARSSACRGGMRRGNGNTLVLSGSRPD